MNSENSFEKLKVWRASHELVLEIYKITKNFPGEEKFSLVDQLKRSSSSIPTNIAEGNERKSKKEYIQFLYISKASLAETKYHLLLSKDLGYITESKYRELQNKAIEISKMISSLIKYLSGTNNLRSEN